jgi:hypothetical protein
MGVREYVKCEEIQVRNRENRGKGLEKAHARIAGGLGE